MDGIFAPLFWMFLGTIFWEFNQSMPGPLAMAWIFKASSTIDSMLGYKEGNLKWLGFTGAKTDDLMVWIPSRIVLITLPFCCKTKQSIFKTIKNSWKDGIVDSSPNSGISEAIFAYCAEVKMGGVNYYKGKKSIKPIIAEQYPMASINSVRKILVLSLSLDIVCLIGFYFIIKFQVISITSTIYESFIGRSKISDPASTALTADSPAQEDFVNAPISSPSVTIKPSKPQSSLKMCLVIIGECDAGNSDESIDGSAM